MITLPTSTSFFVTGGTLSTSATSYVVRQADTDLYESLRNGEFCYVLNSRQMGKSSLMVRAAEKLKAEGMSVAVLDLTSIGQNLTPEQWYDGLLVRLGKQLNLEDALDAFFQAHDNLSPLQRWRDALVEVVLPQVPSALVVFVDEIDVVRSLPFSADEFFAAIRQCYVGRATDPDLKRLTFCLLGTATPADLIQDTRTSPFNIGKRVDVQDFTPDEAAPLAQGLGSSGQALLARILHWTNGHPYLTQRLCQAVAEAGGNAPGDVDRICTELFLTHRAKETDDNLTFVRNRLLRSEVDLAALLDLYRRMRSGRHVPYDETNSLCSVLRLSGVATVREGVLQVRNRIYAHVFDRAWVEAHMPEAELRRQRQAYRRGILRTGALSVVVVAVLAVSLKKAQDESRRANSNALAATRESKRAEEGEKKARIERYAAEMNVGLQALEDGNYAQYTEIVNRQRPSTSKGEEDLRGFEWRLLWRLSRDTRLHTIDSDSLDACGGEVAYSPNGKILAVSGKKRIQLWNTDNWTELVSFSIDSNQNFVTGLAFSPDGRTLASSCQGSRPGNGAAMTLWDVNTRTKRITLTGSIPSVSISKPLFIENGKFVVGPGSDGTRVWGVGTGVWEVATGRKCENKVYTNGAPVAASRDGNITLLRTQQAVFVHNRRSGTRTLVQQGSGGYFATALSPTGGRVAGGSFDGQVTIWNSSTGQIEFNTRASTRMIIRVAFSPDGKSLAAVGQDESVHLLDVSERAPMVTLRGHNGAVHGLAFHPSGKMVATTAWDGSTKIWSTGPTDRRDFVQGWIGDGSSLAGSSLHFSPDSRTLAGGTFAGSVTQWDSATGHVLSTLPGKVGDALAIALSPDGRQVIFGGNDGAIRRWDIASRHVETLFLPYPYGGVLRIGLSSTGDTLIAAYSDNTVQVWNVKSRLLIASRLIPSFQAGPGAFSLSPDDRVLALGGADVSLWQIPSLMPITTIKTGERLNGAVQFSPDGSLLAIAGNRGQITLWDTTTFHRLGVLSGQMGSVAELAFSPDRKTLASVAAQDKYVRLWSLKSHQQLGVLPGSGEDLEQCHVTFSPDGNMLAVNGAGGSVHIWRAATFAETDQAASPAGARVR